MLRKILIAMAVLVSALTMVPAQASDNYRPSFVVRFGNPVVQHHDSQPVYRSYRHDDDDHHYQKRYYQPRHQQYRQQHYSQPRYYQRQYYQQQYQRCGGD